MAFMLFMILGGMMLASQADEAVAKERALFEGVWRFDVVEVDGGKQPDAPFKTNKVIISKDGSYVVMQGARVTHGIMKLDPTKVPKHLDVTITNGPAKGQVFRAVYELEGDTYKFCSSFRTADRPPAVESKAGAGNVFEILKREKMNVADALAEVSRIETAQAKEEQKHTEEGKKAESRSAGAEDADAAQIDHMLLGIGDLECGIDQLEKLIGVRAVFGGKHPSMGTQNALAAVEPGAYLEVIAPQAELPSSQMGMMAGLKQYTKLTPFMFAVRTNDMAKLRQRLTEAGFTTTEPQPGSRVKPDGSTLRWTTMGISGWPAVPKAGEPGEPRPPAVNPALSGAIFVIQWEDMKLHPSITSPPAGELLQLTVLTPDTEAFTNLVVSLGLGRVVVKKAEKLSFEVRLRTSRGEQSIVSE